jgi:AraC-like DNA-binding protein
MPPGAPDQTPPPPRNIHLLAKDSYQLPADARYAIQTYLNPVLPVRVAEERWAGDFHAVSEEGYPVSGLFFVEEGIGWFEVDQQTNTVRAPQVFLYPAQRPRRFWCRRTDPWRVWVIELNIPLDLLRELAGTDAGTWKAPELLTLFRHTRDAAREDDWPGVAQYINVILRELGRREPIPAHRLTAAQELAEAFQQLLQTADPREISSVRDAASQLQSSPRRLTDACRQIHGQSAGSLLRQARMQAAETQLATPGRTVQSVAADFHYADAFAFSKAFRKTRGYPPSQVLDSKPRDA